MKILKITAMAALTLTALSVAAAAPERLNVKLGLWEMTSTMRFSGVPPLPKEVLDKMTPQQRAKMIADLKAAAAEEPEPETSSECVTQADLDNPFKSSNSEDCTSTIVRTTRTTQEIRMVCTGKTKGSGTFKVNTPTPETMNGTLDLKAGDGPDAFVIKGTIKGRWLGADCGDEDNDDNNDEDEDNADQ
ncbi:DUF3617 domain-containing protein [Steroidobacter cummioxidans]|uniref:DUF3617 domain-containing protein n=1 Tax=Steroidobacter cummioxidans TaxID=1803913 RepID=UPI000E314FC3|nr:DUF3617 domain-containing protein [Steroidobacter cummioxidans]